MSMLGTEVVRVVLRGARKAKQAADLLTAESAGLQGRLLEAVERRGKALQQLAQYYLPKLDDQTVAAAFREVRGELEMLQLRQKVRADELRASIAAADAEQAKLDAELAQVTEQLEALVAERTAIETAIAGRLAADAEFQAMAREVAHAETRLERDEERAAELARESKRKLPPYERSRLFQYLLARDWGTSRYASRGFVRRMDGLVARVIDWPRAKAGWDFLRATPELVANEVERRRTEFVARMAMLQKRERTLAEELGLPSVQERGEAIGEKREALLAQLTASNAREQAQRDELARADSASGEHHAEALRRLRSFLDEASAGTLAAHALTTADPVDDRLVVEIDSVTRELDGLRDQLSKLGRDRVAAEARATGLGHVVSRLRATESDTVRCAFENLTSSAFERRIDAAAAGAETPEALLDDLMAQRRYRPRPIASVPQPDGAPWWVLHAVGAIAEIAIKGALSRGITRSGSWGSRGGGRSGGGLGSKGGGFTRGSGF
ncbi:MAG: hypothetical protein HZB39_05860 [Planctomycetes bacterium]|nr:hypothetical protein [Planctomycetota bacterium]